MSSNDYLWRDSFENADGDAPEAGPSPGKRTLTLQLSRAVRPGRSPQSVRAAYKPLGAGARLPQPVQAKMERSLSADFSAVRVHEGPTAPALGARAFAQGTDLHFAPGAYEPGSQRGQELIGHELTHVVQQAEGRVGETRQAKPSAGVAINDDPSLEAEADRLGARAARGESARTGPVVSPAASGAVQRKLMYESASEDALRLATVDDVDSIVSGLEGEDNLFAAIDPDFDETFFDDLDDAVERVVTGSGDFGVFEETNDQHIAMLYFALKRAKAAEDDEQLHEEETADDAGERWDALREASPDEDEDKANTYQVAFLGRGASVAYYISTLGASHDFSTSVLIGTEQPWRVQRGPGVLGHPMHMVTPMRHYIGDTDVGDRWADRGDFSDLIAQVIAQSGVRTVDAGVTKVENRGAFYEIRYNDGEDKRIFAREVISGIGSGDHIKPRGVTEDNDLGHDEVGVEEDTVLDKRIMNMDVFTRVAGKLKKAEDDVVLGAEDSTDEDREEITVVLAGGNAGLDVAFDAVNRHYKVKWVTGSRGPTFLEGFLNYAAFLPFLKYLRDQGKTEYRMGRKTIDIEAEIEKLEGTEDQEGAIEKLYADQQIEADENFEDKQFEEVQVGRIANVAQNAGGVVANVQGGTPVTGDVLVYAISQDMATMDVFADDIVRDLRPDMDRDHRFEDGDDTALGLRSGSGRLKMIGATAYRAHNQKFNPRDKEKIAAIAAEIQTAVENFRANKNTANRKRLRRRIDKLKKALALEPGLVQLESRDMGHALRRMRELASSMTKVISSLPPNVLINDQLTAILAEIDALNSFVPYDANENANFLIGDRTTLRIYVTCQCPDLAMPVGDGVVEVIITSRRRGIEDLPPPVPPRQVAFQDAWEAALGEADGDSTVESIRDRFVELYGAAIAD